MRAIKVRDENVIPTALPAKTIHQRNKSSPALSTLAQTGALKLAAKRTAFADVSNVARGGMTVKDDSAILTKSTLQPLRDVVAQENNKATTLLRPAQRPLSVAGVKGFFNSLASGSSSGLARTTALQVRQEAVAQQPANTKKPLARKATTVFRETEALPADYAQIIANAEDVHKPAVSEVLAPQPLLPIQFEAPYVPSNGVQQHSFYAPKPVVLPELQEAIILDQQRRALEAAYLPFKERQGSFNATEIYEDAATHVASQTQPHLVDKRVISRITEAEERMAPIDAESPQGFEPQGLYDDEYYDDQYEDDGYTTGRSLKSRGEYTTGPTTVLLVPRMTAKVERELAAARDYVEASRTAHEIEEDESWDTSMVAEYGDEIFGYMRVLEVSPLSAACVELSANSTRNK